MGVMIQQLTSLQETTFMPEELTERQQQVLDVIARWLREHQVPPSVRELGKALGLSSVRAVTDHLQALERKGYIERLKGSARTIRLLTEEVQQMWEATVRIPVLGRIAAGEPLLATQYVEDYLTVGESLTRGGGADCFALSVKGDSMVGAGIYDGDYVIVRRQSTAQNGEIIAALLDEEATVKRFESHGSRILLKPENPRLSPIAVEAGSVDFRILGKVIAVLRSMP
jgi:repressor LexA